MGKKTKYQMSISILNNEKSYLGEGLYVDNTNKVFFYVDITKKNVIKYNKSNRFDYLDYPNIPSCIFSCNKNGITLLDDMGISFFNFENHSNKLILDLSCEIRDRGYRGNDGLYHNDSYFFGTMHKEDAKNNIGALYHFKNKKLVKFDEMHIPNSFILNDNNLLISDSFKKIIYSYDIVTLEKTLWADLSDINLVPDGGCISDDGRIFIALWGSSSIGEFDKNGSIVQIYQVPPFQPTNCKMFGNKKIIFTSATIGMNKDMMLLYPDSGKTFIMDI